MPPKGDGKVGRGQLGAYVYGHCTPLSLAHTILSEHVWGYCCESRALEEKVFSDLLRCPIAGIVRMHASQRDPVRVAKGNV
eukprot:2675834-Pleurochrysis_carterae.AAC.1